MEFLSSFLRHRIAMLHRTISHPVRRLATLSKIPTARPSLLEDFKTGDNGAHAQDVPMFTISRSRGFLPRLVRMQFAAVDKTDDSSQDPLVELPAQFAKVESLLQRMTIKQRDGSVGLLGKGEMGDAVRQELGNDEQITFAVDRAIASGDQVCIGPDASTRTSADMSLATHFGAVPRLLVPHFGVPPRAGGPALPRYRRLLPGT